MGVGWGNQAGWICGLELLPKENFQPRVRFSVLYVLFSATGDKIQSCLALGMLVLHVFYLLVQMRFEEEKKYILAIVSRALKLILVRPSCSGMDMAAGISLRFHSSAS